MTRLTALFSPWSGDVVDVDDRDAVEILEPCPEGDDLEKVWHDLDVDAFPVGHLDQVEHLGMLVERQRDIQLVHPLPAENVIDLGQRTEER